MANTYYNILNTDSHNCSVPVDYRPLTETIKFTGYNRLGGIDSHRIGAVFDGTYLWFSPHTESILWRINVQTDEVESFPLVVDGQNININNGLKNKFLLCDGTYLWCLFLLALPEPKILKIKLSDVSMELVTLAERNSNLNIETLSGGVFDGKDIWLLAQDKKLVKLETEANIVTSYDLEERMNSITFGNGCLWLSYGNANTLAKVELESINITYLTIPEELVDVKTAVYSGITFDSRYIWLTSSYSNSIIKFDTLTEEFSSLQMETGENIGTAATISNSVSRWQSSIFDGRYIWLPPCNVDRLIRIDTKTDSIKGYPYSSGINLGDTNSKTFTFSSGAYDGTNIWLIPRYANRVVKVSPAEEADYFTVVEKYQDEDGITIRIDTRKYIVAGQDYLYNAPFISGYTYLGYRLDGSELIASQQVKIENIEQEHEVIFVYQKDEDGNSNGNNNGGGDCNCNNNNNSCGKNHGCGCNCFSVIFNTEAINVTFQDAKIINYNTCCCCKNELKDNEQEKETHC